MKIVREAVAGTLESRDVMVRIEPSLGTTTISVTSIAQAQFGDAIHDEVLATLEKLGVENATVRVDDKGALDCVIRARVQAAVARACDESIFAWEKLS